MPWALDFLRNIAISKTHPSADTPHMVEKYLPQQRPEAFLDPHASALPGRKQAQHYGEAHGYQV
ncbi:hypothetical protein VSDG_02038 [Cytospora chrysosperma]|uniref:Uncharacterized protein n=1 Tax=Cytospora chrysosperma TaxID=252740 RepID=A0A423WDX0_CYTCH|nr:hypothetical protein VSDG_02038 [Valsa sordida]